MNNDLVGDIAVYYSTVGRLNYVTDRNLVSTRC